MKICPLCDQKYADDAMVFCLVDGAGLKQLDSETPNLDVTLKYPPFPKIEQFVNRKKIILKKWFLWFVCGTCLFCAGILVGKVIVYPISSSPPNESASGGSSANTDDAPEITLDKFMQIENDMNLKQVNQIIGRDGVLVSKSDYTYTQQVSEGTAYQWGSSAKFIMVGFYNDKVITKSHNGLIK